MIDAEAFNAFFFNMVNGRGWICVALVVFAFVVKPTNALMSLSQRRESPDPSTRKCPECRSEIPIDARRCAFCTSEVIV